MKKSFCTIITADYMSYAHVLLQSLMSAGENVELNILVVDADRDQFETNDHIRIFGLDDLSNDDLGKKIIKKYGKDVSSTLRWALKPIFIRHLLNTAIGKLIYVDPDIAFFGNPDFLFEELETSNFLLTPHWRNIDPDKGRNQFQLVFKEGLYNAGFIGAARGCESAMDWWAKACLDTCSREEYAGFYDDQAYLNALPLYFSGVKVLQHRGCNVAAWNRKVNERSLVNGEVRIAGEYPVIFIHFTPSTMRDIASGKDGLLLPFLNTYQEWLKHNGIETKIPEKGGFLKKLGLR